MISTGLHRAPIEVSRHVHRWALGGDVWRSSMGDLYVSSCAAHGDPNHAGDRWPSESGSVSRSPVGATHERGPRHRSAGAVRSLVTRVSAGEWLPCQSDASVLHVRS